MTTAAQTPRILYSGSSGGTLGPFALQTDGTTWTYTSSAQIRVTRFASATAALSAGTLLVEGTDYDIASDEVTLTSPQTGLLDTERLLIERVEPLTQTLDLDDTQKIRSTVLEARLDTMERQLQDVNLKAGRNLKMHWTETVDVELPPVSTRASKLLGFDASGVPIATAADGSDGGAAQPVDATLTALAGLSITSNKLIRGTGTDTFDLIDFLDEDDMASDSATGLPSQQSVKAYVDTRYPFVAEQASQAGNVTAIEAAITAGIDFHLQANTYQINDQIDVDSGQRTIMGASPLATAFNADGEQTCLQQTADNEYIIDVSSANFVLSQVELEHSGNAALAHMRLQRSDLSADVDTRLIDVFINNTSAGRGSVYLNGRGLDVRGGSFVNGIDTVFDLNWETSGDAITEGNGDGDTKGPLKGFRRFSFYDMIGHGTSLTMIENTGANKKNISGLIASGTLMDVGGELYRGTLRQSGLFSSVLNWANVQPVELEDGTEAGIFSGWSVNGSRDVASLRPDGVIIVKEGDHDCLVIGPGAASYIEDDVIRLDGNGVGTSSIKKLVIVGISATESGTEAGAKYFLHADNVTIEDLVIVGCAYGQHANNTATEVLKFDTCTVSRVTLAGFTYDTSSLSLVASGDAVNVFIAGDGETGLRRNADGSVDVMINGTQHQRFQTNGDTGIGTSSDTLTRRLEIRDGSATAARFSRDATGSASGFDIASKNSAAEYIPWVTVFGSATDSTDGAEDGLLQIQTIQAGSTGVRAGLGAGLYMTGASGGDQGAGTVNATAHHVGSVFWSSGSGSPESAVTAPVGSLYSRTDGGASTTLYVKESGSGNTGWVAK
ncbi:hypothetical protein [Henriciella pelagia]|uniref:hypothetical protein n=1 Tax=Henriciella pelagia TaxID=1977912 RepID=UPI003511E1CA